MIKLLSDVDLALELGKVPDSLDLHALDLAACEAKSLRHHGALQKGPPFLQGVANGVF